jgi:hypothetical protein
MPYRTTSKISTSQNCDGLGKSSTNFFDKFCSSQIALRRGSFYSEIVHGSSLHTQLYTLLADIEATYLDLNGGNSWHRIVPLPAQSTFLADHAPDEDEEHEARALTAKSTFLGMNGSNYLPFVTLVIRRGTFTLIAPST